MSEHDHHHVPHTQDDHDHGPEVPLEENPLWLQDNVELTSVGVDIGSSGSQVVFSRLLLRRMGERLTSRYVVVERDTFYVSDVMLTPYVGETLIDAGALGGWLDETYAAARVVPEEVDTGVVILTGEALRRENAQHIAAVVADRAGDLVCATAGHHMEARLAAFGSGAARLSHRLGARILNIDIGGGTTKFSVIDHGEISQTAAIHVGGRLAVRDGDHVVRLEPAGRTHALAAGLDWHLGGPVAPGEFAIVAEAMADLVLAAILGSTDEQVAAAYLTDPLADLGGLQGIVLSGGVAEYAYERETKDFNDFGIHLGKALRARFDAFPAPVLDAENRIRATVLGASEYAIQLSGITSWVPDPGLLPKRNLQVIRPRVPVGDEFTAAGIAAAIRAHRMSFDLGVDDEVALAMAWPHDSPEYPMLRTFAEGIVAALEGGTGPAFLLVDADIARTLGRIMRDELGFARPLTVLDGLDLRDFDYVDLGRLREPSKTVPVTIKSLLFSSSELFPATAEAVI